jgi:hypothetical protein
MVVQQHTINRQIIELVVAKQDDVQHLCQLAEDVFQAQVLPELDRYFSDVCSSETLVIIDHLEIDIGHISQGNFQNDFVENIFRAIHQSLPTLAMQTARDQIFRKPLEDPMPIGRRQSGVDAPTGKQRALSAHQSSFECLDCFLNTGTVPWWHIPSEKQSIEQWFRDASTSPAELRFMLKTHLADPIHRTRLIHQLSESLMFSVAELLQPNIAESIHQAATNLATLQAKTDWIQLSSDSFRFCVWTEVIEMLLDQERKEHNRGLCLLRILNALAVQSNTSCNELVLALQTKLEKEYKTQNLYDLYTTLEALHSEDATQRITGPADDTSLSTLQPSPQNYPIPANAGSWATTIESESNKPIIHDDEDSKTEQASQPQDNIASNEEPAKTECQDEAYGLLGTYHQFLNDLSMTALDLLKTFRPV